MYVLTKPLAVAATSCGEPLPPSRIAALKSSTALPNHMRMTRNEVRPARDENKPLFKDYLTTRYPPIMKPNNPIHAVERCTMGRSNQGPAFPSLLLRAVNVNRRKNMKVNANETAMNAGVVAVGADSRSGALDGRFERSKI